MTKSEIRKQIKISLIEYQRMLPEESERISNKIIQSSYFQSAKIVLCYMALNDEVNVDTVIKEAMLQNKIVALPKIVPDTNQMDFYKISDFNFNNFHKSKKSFDIFEPESNQDFLLTPEQLTEQTLILVPGRAFSVDGKRIGRGKGFYDIWLSKIPENKKNRVHLAGICFPQQIVENIPSDEHDIKMDEIIY